MTVLVETPDGTPPHTGQAVMFLGSWYQVRKVTSGGKDVVLRKLNPKLVSELRQRIDYTNEIAAAQKKAKSPLRKLGRWCSSPFNGKK